MSNNNKGRTFSPKRQPGGPRRCVSHDSQTLRRQFQKDNNATDDDGFTTISNNPSSNTNRKKGVSRFANAAASASDNNIKGGGTPRGRVNPTSSFNRPRPANSFNKPRNSTGPFKKGNPGKSNSFHHGSRNSGAAGGGGGGGGGFNGMAGGRARTPIRGDQNRSRSFNKPRPVGSFDQGNFNSNSNNNTPNSKAAKQDKYKRSTSRMNSHDVELYLQGDGFNRDQCNVIRVHVDMLMQARLMHLDPPSFGLGIIATTATTHDVSDDGAKNENSSTDKTNNSNNPVNENDEWEPHHKCLWNDPTRRDQIDQVMQQYPNAIPLHMKTRKRIKSSKLGDSTTSSASGAKGGEDASEQDDSSVGTSIRSGSDHTKLEGDTAADLEDLNPLRKVLLLMNKLSWTTIDKLTPKLFAILEVDVPKILPPSSQPAVVTVANDISKDVGEIDDSESSDGANNSNTDPSAEVSPMVVTILNLMVDKAQTEPHFSAMYATLCRNLAERNAAWKKKMLAHCQTEFEHDVAWHTARLDERLARMEDTSSNTNATEDMDRDYQIVQIRKKYVGHVQFIGELFKLKLIKPDIMIWCLSRLLFHKEEADEDDLECFIKLMTVVGEQAEYLVKKGKCHAVAEEKWYQCWDRVYFLTGRKNTKKRQSSSSKPETAATVSKDEAPKPPKISSRLKFMLVDLLDLEENDWVHRRKTDKAKTIAEIHKEVQEEEAEARRRSYSDNFSGFGSFGNRRRSSSNDNYPSSPKLDRKPKADTDGFTAVPKRSSLMRRTVSDVEVSDIYNKEKPFGARKSQTPASKSPASKSSATPKIVEYPDPEQCKEKTKTILKEYFVNPDADEAIRSLDEIIGAGSSNEDHGSVDRGAAVIESGVLLVMEMKQEDVQKFLAVIKRCLQKKKIEKESLPIGLKDPLEFLSDIEIDAPMARALLTSIVAYWVRQDALPFAFLLDAPDYFKTDSKPAEFAAAVLKVRGGEATAEDLSVVEKLMTEEDKKSHASAADMVGPLN